MVLVVAYDPNLHEIQLLPHHYVTGCVIQPVDKVYERGIVVVPVCALYSQVNEDTMKIAKIRRSDVEHI